MKTLNVFLLNNHLAGWDVSFMFLSNKIETCWFWKIVSILEVGLQTRELKLSGMLKGALTER